MSSHSTLVSIVVSVLGWGVVFGYLTARLKMDDQSPTSTGKGPDVIEQALDEALAKGKIAYDIPAEMKREKPRKLKFGLPRVSIKMSWPH